MLWLFAMLFFSCIFYLHFSSDKIDNKKEVLSAFFEGNEKIKAVVHGRICSIEEKTNSNYIYLSDVIVSIEGEQNKCRLKKVLIITDNKECKFFIGNIIVSKGSIFKLESATNPGQFDEKDYYRQKGIYYKMYADKTGIEDNRVKTLNNFLYIQKKRLKQIYGRFLSEENAGIAAAMLLGDKSQLDMDAKKLYQANGVGHLLAISGLHVSILCMGLYRFLFFVNCKRKYIPPIVSISIICYGIMTGYSVSACRAIIMMVLFLLSEVLGRSYDILSALSFSGIVIIFINPYLAVSSGFCLSFCAVFGIAVFLPAMRHAVFGDKRRQRKTGRMKIRQKKILSSAFCRHNFKECINPILWLMKNSLLECITANISIQVVTLPVLLYFFYEYPPYSLLLNMILLPLAPVLVGTLAAGGILGLFYSFPAFIFLKAGDILLCMYSCVSKWFLRLPFNVIITGRPSVKLICIYIICLFIFICLYYSCVDGLPDKPIYKIPKIINILSEKFFCFLILPLFGCMVLFIPHSPDGLETTFLDVGQGDGIVISTKPKSAVLIDGGSTNVSEVGRYRIIPFLKYKGIAKIDFMIMTHEDMDHISGQLELLETGREEGITVKCLLLPKPAAASTGDNYKKIIKLANKKKVPISFIHEGDILEGGNLKLKCIHPKEGFLSDSFNAYSTTLQLSYGGIDMLLTGDLEKNGENESVKKIRNYSQSFDLLKVAHHGSKNSTSQKFLDAVRAKLGIISCGKKNRYGHPHEELLDRLQKAGCKYFTTSDNGALTVRSDGNNIVVTGFIGQ